MTTDDAAVTQGGPRRDRWDPPGWVRIPLLEAVLGCAPEQISWETLERITIEQVSENACLDFKRGLYGPRQNMDEFCKDVAAFANASGGLLVLGIREDGRARAMSLDPVPITDSERRRMIDASLRIAPIVPDLSIGEILDPNDPDQGVFLVLVPASAQAPHATEREHRMQWPVREDRKTRWMSEPEIASRYRARFDQARSQDDRLDSVMNEGRRSLVKQSHAAWLCIALSPALPGGGRVSRDTVRNWIDNGLRGVPWRSLVQAKNMSIGRRRIILSDETPFHGSSSDVHFELHSNGSGFAAISLQSRPPEHAQRQTLASDTIYVDVENVAIWTTALLDILAKHAANASAGGDYAISAQLVPGGYSEVSTDPLPAAMVEPFQVNGRRFDGSRLVPGSRSIAQPSLTYTTTTPGLVLSPRDLLKTAHDVIHDLLGEFGATPSDPIVNMDGTIDQSALASPYLSSLTDWAARVGLVNQRDRSY